MRHLIDSRLLLRIAGSIKLTVKSSPADLSFKTLNHSAQVDDRSLDGKGLSVYPG